MDAAQVGFWSVVALVVLALLRIAGEGETEIAEHLDRHLPLAVPFDGGLVEPVGLYGVVAYDARPANADAVERRVHGEDGIHGRFHRAGPPAPARRRLGEQRKRYLGK